MLKNERDRDQTYVSCFSPGRDKLPGKSNLRKEGFVFVLALSLGVAEGSWSHCVFKEQRETAANVQLPFFILSRIPAHGTISPTLREHLR